MVRFVVCGLALVSLLMPAIAGAARPLPGGHFVLTYSSTRRDQVSMLLHVSRQRDRFVPFSGVGVDSCASAVTTGEELSLSSDFRARVKHPPVKITPQGFFAAHWVESDGSDFRIQGRFVTGRILRGTLSLRKHLGRRVCNDSIGIRFRAHWVSWTKLAPPGEAPL